METMDMAYSFFSDFDIKNLDAKQIIESMTFFFKIFKMYAIGQVRKLRNELMEKINSYGIFSQRLSLKECIDLIVTFAKYIYTKTVTWLENFLTNKEFRSEKLSKLNDLKNYIVKKIFFSIVYVVGQLISLYNSLTLENIHVMIEKLTGMICYVQEKILSMFYFMLQQFYINTLIKYIEIRKFMNSKKVLLVKTYIKTNINGVVKNTNALIDNLYAESNKNSIISFIYNSKYQSLFEPFINSLTYVTFHEMVDENKVKMHTYIFHFDNVKKMDDEYNYNYETNTTLNKTINKLQIIISPFDYKAFDNFDIYLVSNGVHIQKDEMEKIMNKMGIDWNEKNEKDFLSFFRFINYNKDKWLLR
jgi:hypothetical protein